MKKLSKKAQHRWAIGIGLCYSMLYICSQEIPRAGELYAISKVAEWTGMVFVFLFGLNLDLYSVRSAKIAGVSMLTIHARLMWFFYPFSDLNYIAIATLAIIEAMVFEIAFARIRNRMASDSQLDNAQN